MQRRAFVTTATGAVLTAALPYRPRWLGRSAPGTTVDGGAARPVLGDPQVRALVLSAVDAARQAGARYADVRLTYTRKREVSASWATESEELGLSVRALVDGYWGWAATPYVAAGEAPRVAQAAVALAKMSARSRLPRQVEWTPVPGAGEREETWSTPIRRDPFTVATRETMEWAQGLLEWIRHEGPVRDSGSGTIGVWVNMWTQERVWASTEGKYCTQTVYVTHPYAYADYIHGRVDSGTRPKQVGYEYVTDTPFRAILQRAMDRADAAAQHPLPGKVLQIGRYDLVLDAGAMAQLVARTLAPATQADRMLGYEANAGGTSYLGTDPLEVLGTRVASPRVTVTADRSAPGALATIGWDEEGVRPEPFTLVKDGVLVDCQTTREQAAWLAPWYQKQGQPGQSHGCAAGQDALFITLQHTPNLTLQPQAGAHGVEELIAGVEQGLLLEGWEHAYPEWSVDPQAASGLVRLVGAATELRHGKRVAAVNLLTQPYKGWSFRSAELWNKITALGGPASLEQYYPMESTKGEPAQQMRYSVAAVPALIPQQAIVNGWGNEV